MLSSKLSLYAVVYEEALIAINAKLGALINNQYKKYESIWEPQKELRL